MNIFEILKLLNTAKPQTSQEQNNSSFANYPFEAFSQNKSSENNQNPFGNSINSDNNFLPLLLSMLGKNGDLSKVFSQGNQTKEEVKKESSSPKDELLL